MEGGIKYGFKNKNPWWIYRQEEIYIFNWFMPSNRYYDFVSDIKRKKK